MMGISVFEAIGMAVAFVLDCRVAPRLAAARGRRRDGDAAYVGMRGSRTKRLTFTRYAARESVDTTALVCPIGGGYPRDKRPEVIAAFAAAEILARMIASAARQNAGHPAHEFCQTL
jgi:xanthine dehydrogenase accessory factor